VRAIRGSPHVVGNAVWAHEMSSTCGKGALMWRGAVCGEEHGFCEADMSTPRAYKAEGARANTVAGWVAMRTTQHLLWFAEAPHGV